MIGKIEGDDRAFDPAPFIIGRVAMFGADHFADKLPPGGMFHVWDKDPRAALQWDSFSDAELFWTNFTEKRRVIRYLWKGLCQAGAAQKREHPTAKPVEVMRLVVEIVGGCHILDPFMGSGPTGVACLNLGRKFTGIEIEPTYFDIACRRIEEAHKQPRLFEEPAPKPVQGVMAL